MIFESPYFYAIGKYHNFVDEVNESKSESKIDYKSRERDLVHSLLNEKVELSFHISEESKNSSKPKVRDFSIEKRFSNKKNQFPSSSPKFESDVYVSQQSKSPI